MSNNNTSTKFAKEIILKNDKGNYTVPTPRLYPYQWNWDSVFASLGLCTFDQERAWVELESLVEGQWENGMIPHIIFRQNDPDYFPGPMIWKQPTSAGVNIPTSCYSQPPVFASILKTLIKKSKDYTPSKSNRGYCVYQNALRWHRWWHTERDPYQTGVVAIAHPWESGRDNSPDWDEPMSQIEVNPYLEKYQRRDTKHVDPNERPQQLEYDKYLTILKYGRDNNWNSKKIADDGFFWVADPGINFILFRANCDLLKLAFKFKDKKAIKEIKHYIELSEHGLPSLWNENAQGFCAKNLKNSKFCDNFSNASALLFYANFGSNSQKNTSKEKIHDILKRVKFGMPSTDPNHPSFESQRYWRGPVWLIMNYMIAKGFEENGMTELSNRLFNDSMSLIEQNGYHEYFNPISGTGHGGSDFTWTAAIKLAWKS